MVLLTVLDFYHFALIEQKLQFLSKNQRAVHSYMYEVPNTNCCTLLFHLAMFASFHNQSLLLTMLTGRSGRLRCPENAMHM